MTLSTIVKSKTYKIILIVISLFLLLSTCVILVLSNTKAEQLSPEQISILRSQYPVCGTETPYMLSMTKLTLEDCTNIADTFLYGEIEGDIQYYSKNISTGDIELDQKRAENGISNTYDFYEYTLVILSDTSEKYEPGDRVTIAANVLFKDYNPQFQDGMRIVTPIRADQNNASRTYFGTEGTYYVTPDGYAISVFEEDAASYAAAPSGLRVETLLEKLKEMQK